MSENKQDKKAGQQKPVQKQQKKQQKKQNQKDAQVLKLLEQDQDDFQEFQEDAYDERPPEKIKAKQWREDWEDQDANDDFAERLRKQIGA